MHQINIQTVNPLNQKTQAVCFCVKDGELSIALHEYRRGRFIKTPYASTGKIPPDKTEFLANFLKLNYAT